MTDYQEVATELADILDIRGPDRRQIAILHLHISLIKAHGEGVREGVEALASAHSRSLAELEAKWKQQTGAEQVPEVPL